MRMCKKYEHVLRPASDGRLEGARRSYVDPATPPHPGTWLVSLFFSFPPPSSSSDMHDESYQEHHPLLEPTLVLHLLTTLLLVQNHKLVCDHLTAARVHIFAPLHTLVGSARKAAAKSRDRASNKFDLAFKLRNEAKRLSKLGFASPEVRVLDLRSLVCISDWRNTRQSCVPRSDYRAA